MADLAALKRLKQPMRRHGDVPAVGDARVLLQADAKGNRLALQIAQPVTAHELAIRQQRADARPAKGGQKTLQEGDALGGVGVPPMRQQLPEDRNGNPAISNAQHQNVDVASSSGHHASPGARPRFA